MISKETRMRIVAFVEKHGVRIMKVALLLTYAVVLSFIAMLTAGLLYAYAALVAQEYGVQIALLEFYSLLSPAVLWGCFLAYVLAAAPATLVMEYVMRGLNWGSDFWTFIMSESKEVPRGQSH